MVEFLVSDILHIIRNPEWPENQLSERSRGRVKEVLETDDTEFQFRIVLPIENPQLGSTTHYLAEITHGIRLCLILALTDEQHLARYESLRELNNKTA
jgi:hypothetical protein